MRGRNLYHWGQRVVGLATVIVVVPVAAWACAVCFAGDDALARGLNVSILFLMSMPFVIFGVIAGTVYVAQKRAQGQSWWPMVSQGLAWTQKESAK